jgi:hypothetical protein
MKITIDLENIYLISTTVGFKLTDAGKIARF